MRGFFFENFYEFSRRKKNQRQKRISQGKRFNFQALLSLEVSLVDPASGEKNLVAFWAAPELFSLAFFCSMILPFFVFSFVI